MKLVSFKRNGARHAEAGFGALAGQGIVDMAARLPGLGSIQDLLADPARLEAARDLAARGATDFVLDQVQLEPVIPSPSKIICVGLNYVEHAAEAGRAIGKYPTIFHRFADTLVAHDQPLIRPRVSADFDYEGELAVIIGKGGAHIRPEDAMSHVAGYTCFNDASVRDWQFHTHQYGMGKNFVGSGALGPWMVSADEIPDYRKLQLRTRLNGEQMQFGELSQLAFDVPYLISYISQAMPWRPGDILATGTPSGIGFKRNPPVFMKPGDVIEVEISHIGVLRNPVAAEP